MTIHTQFGINAHSFHASVLGTVPSLPATANL